MSHEEQKNKFRMLDRWLVSEMGMHAMAAFNAELLRLDEPMCGETVVQLGGCHDKALLLKLQYTRKWIASPYQTAGADLITFFHQLTFDRDSLDCVVAPLTLEAFINKDDVLDEIDRVLKPMGYIIFFGINPVSLWGLWRRYSANGCFGHARSTSKSVLALKLAMQHRGYTQRFLSKFYYIPPVKSHAWIERFEICNEIGKMISPMPAAFYCLVVQKQQENGIVRTTLDMSKPVLTTAPQLQPAAHSNLNVMRFPYES